MMNNQKDKDKTVFVWKEFRDWKHAIERLYPNILTFQIETQVQNVTIQHDNGEEAFNGLTNHSIGSMVSTSQINEFRKVYSYIRVYHACRPENISSYYEKGLIPRNKAAQVERFRKIFFNDKFPELTEEMLQQSIERCEYFYPNDDGELHFNIDDRFSIEHCGLYLIYGSEYLVALVNHLQTENTNKDLYLSKLRKIGTPTIFKIDLPNTPEYIEDFVIGEIIQKMLTGWVWCLANSMEQPYELEQGITLHKPLSPEYIFSHYHPPKIEDRQYNKIYVTETGKYEEQNKGLS